MFSFDKTDLQRVAVSALGAVALTGACIAGAVAPLHAAPAPVVTTADWVSTVERKLDTYSDSAALRMAPGTTAATELALRFTADGDYAGADVARSSGDAVIDAHAVHVANTVRYPALPAALKGRPSTVAMRLVFGMATDQTQETAMRERLARPAQVAQAQSSGQVAVK